MGYTTEFRGRFKVEPPLSPEEVEFLTKFNGTRRMDRANGPYFVDGSGFLGQDNGPDRVYDLNRPPPGQPSLWCQWAPTPDGQYIEWDGGEKAYYMPEWIEYIIDHFLKKGHRAQLPVLSKEGHVLNGIVEAQGEDMDDRWRLVITDNVVEVKKLRWAE